MGKGNSILGRVENGVFSCPYFSFPVEKEEGNYSFFFRERQLSFVREDIAERQIAEKQGESLLQEKEGSIEEQKAGDDEAGDSMVGYSKSKEEVAGTIGTTEALSPFKLIEKEYLGEFSRAFYKNPEGQVLSCLIERGEELPERGFPTLCFKEGEEKILFLLKEGE